jgi:hypothetical protein
MAALLAVAATCLLPVPSLAQGAGMNVQTISAADGGQVTSPSGGATLEVPPGGLVADTQVSIAELPPEESPTVGPVYELKPDGLQFVQPATLTIRFAPGDVPEGYEAEDVMISQVMSAEPVPAEVETPAAAPAAPAEAGAQMVPAIAPGILDTTVDLEAGTASAQLAHLSRYTLRSLAGHRLGTRQSLTRGVTKFLDMMLAPHWVGKAGSADSSCAVTGEFILQAEVPNGNEGLAFAQAIGVKLFRVKPGDDGQREATDGRVDVQLEHTGEIQPGTNSYQIGYSVSLRDCGVVDYAASFLGRPKFHDVGGPVAAGGISSQQLGHELPGMRFQRGGVERAFAMHPDIKMTRFPLGPPYRPESPLISFERCHLIAGHLYAVQVSAQISVPGGPYKNMGGGAYFPLNAFTINWVEVSSG